MRRRKTTFTRLYLKTRGDPTLFPHSLSRNAEKTRQCMTTMCSQTIMRKMTVYGKREAFPRYMCESLALVSDYALLNVTE